MCHLNSFKVCHSSILEFSSNSNLHDQSVRGRRHTEDPPPPGGSPPPLFHSVLLIFQTTITISIPHDWRLCGLTPDYLTKGPLKTCNLPILPYTGR